MAQSLVLFAWALLCLLAMTPAAAQRLAVIADGHRAADLSTYQTGISGSSSGGGSSGSFGSYFMFYFYVNGVGYFDYTVDTQSWFRIGTSNYMQLGYTGSRNVYSYAFGGKRLTSSGGINYQSSFMDISFFPYGVGSIQLEITIVVDSSYQYVEVRSGTINTAGNAGSWTMPNGATFTPLASSQSAVLRSDKSGYGWTAFHGYHLTAYQVCHGRRCYCQVLRFLACIEGLHGLLATAASALQLSASIRRSII